MTEREVVFLLDVDNTLLDGDRVVVDFHNYLKQQLGSTCARRYWSIFDRLRNALGYVDYLGALQQYRLELEHGDANEQQLMMAAAFLIDYPFADRIYARALETLVHLDQYGSTVILSDGDIVLQPRKIQRSGLWQAVQGRALIYVHKEKMLPAVQRHYPARHYVMVDDKLGVLAAMKSIWRERLTTVFIRQGHYALDSKIIAAQPAADITIECIGDLVTLDRSHWGPPAIHR
ncbi:HAD family hydrolase [Pseudomonas sp. 1152_12]|uniref:HAD family hydrolase n=1 Tax=Pseudomonas sp. 1152_12 TaxID=2604455 RepID=UPI004063A9CB